MPDPKPGESRKDYMDRCMSDAKTREKYANPAQRAAVCNSMFKDAKEASVAQIMKIETVEALQYGRPGKKDVRKTPAEPSERRKGSKRNKPGSAKKPNKNIKTSEGTEAKLRNLMTEHNKKNKGSKATMGMLKTVFRRGTGAFSRSHAPKMNRTGWGIARVKAFLYLLRNGRPSNPNYKQDNDLLPRGHPRAGGKKKKEAKASESKMIGTGDDDLGTVDDPVQASTHLDDIFEYYPEAEYEDWGVESEVIELSAAEYQGKKVTLNKPFRTSGGPKKFAVYTKNEKGTVVIVRFGDPNMEIKRDDPQRRKNFRSRHNCDSPGPKWKARYWSCYQWRSGAKVKAEEGCGCGCSGESVEAAEPKPKSTETHEEYMDRCTAMGYTKEECMKAHEGHKFKDQEAPHYEKDHAKANQNVEAKKIGKDAYDNPGEARKRAKELGLDDIHSMEKDGETIFMPGKNHEEYMKKTGKKMKMEGYDDEEEKKAKHYGDSCPPGKKMKDGKCVRVAVTLDLNVEEIDTVLEASTGKTVMRIKGIAFTEGINKNSWGIRPSLAKRLADEMVGADVTLNHPKAEMGRFKRNMNGGVDEAVVGEVKEASYHARSGGYVVRYVAEVYRPELFSALESGLWLRPEYGVSIGGTGVPTEVIEAEQEGQRPTMWFADEFNFDHLAIVHKPAYPEANIEVVEKVEASEIFKYHTESSTVQSKVTKMSDEQEVIDTQVNEIEALKADLVLKEARIAEFMAAEEARVEESRLALVKKASDLGLAGHEDFSSETLEKVIASWEASRPAPVEEPVVEMEAATPAASEPVEASEKESEPVVANYLNGRKIESPVSLYARAYNAWVRAYNDAYSGVHSAKTYEELNN